MYNIIIIIIILILIAIFYTDKRYTYNESFANNQIFTIKKHIRLNKFNRIDSLTIFPPQPRAGEAECNVVTCPAWIPDTNVCYKCA